VYLLDLHFPTFARIVGLSAVFVCVTPFISRLPLDYSLTVGACLSLLSPILLFPIAMRPNTAGGSLGFPGAPFVVLNFVYFVLATLVPLVYPQVRILSVSVESIPLALLILCLGFLFFDVGVFISGKMPNSWPPPSSGATRVRGLGAIFAVLVGALWGLRLVLAIRGWGITHASNLLAFDWQLRQLVALANAIAFMPLCLCLARLCSSGSSKVELRRWQRRLVWVLAADLAYYLWAGARLLLLWEGLIAFWCVWLRLTPALPRRRLFLLCVSFALAMPIVYAERDALGYAFPHEGENQVGLTRTYLLPEETRILRRSMVATVKAGLDADSGRLTAVGPFAAVADGLFNGDVPLMWGEIWSKELPILMPRILWPSKPIQASVDQLINRHFDLPGDDDLTTYQTELLASFGIGGLCGGMLLFGFLTERILGFLVRNAATSEPAAFCILYAMPALFRVETDTSGILAGLRLIPVLWIFLTLLSVRRSVRQT
jgi:hypothetical protein